MKSSKLNIVNEVLRVNVVFLSFCDYTKTVKGDKWKVLYCLTGKSIRRKSQVNNNKTSPNLIKNMMKRDKITKQPINRMKGDFKNVETLFCVCWDDDVWLKICTNGFKF